MILNDGVKANMVIRDGQVVAPPNRVILKQVKKSEPISTFLIIPESVKNEAEYFHNVFEVVAVGELDNRLNKRDPYRDSSAIPEVGKKIVVGMNSGLAIEPPMTQTLSEPLFYCKLSEVMAYYEKIA
jgi:co-chaperonin GroES (HSP10)